MSIEKLIQQINDHLKDQGMVVKTIEFESIEASSIEKESTVLECSYPCVEWKTVRGVKVCKRRTRDCIGNNPD